MKKFLFVDSNGDATEGLVDGVFETRNCPVDLAVGEFVVESTTIALGVDKVTDNRDERTVFGICVEKPTTATAVICTKGRINGFDDFDTGLKVYLSSVGRPTAAQPEYGYIHILGHAISGIEFDFNPANTKIKQPVMSAPPQPPYVVDSNPVDWDLSDVNNGGDTSTKEHEFGE